MSRFGGYAGLRDQEGFIKNVLILGSAPSAVDSSRLLGEATIVVALNNAHAACSRVDYAFHAGDFPERSRHPQVARIGRSAPQYMPAVRAFGGLMFCGATIAFAAAYWAIHNFPYSQVSFYACDMVYGDGDSHFYGRGVADPLRRNMSLQSLEAKSLRFFYFGLKNDVLFLNASQSPVSRLALPRIEQGVAFTEVFVQKMRSELNVLFERLDEAASEAIALEGQDISIDPLREDYWVYASREDVWEHLRRVDQSWLLLRDPVREFSAQLQRTIGPMG